MANKFMDSIAIVTENRINQLNGLEGTILKNILDKQKYERCCGDATVKELTKWNETLPNNFIVHGFQYNADIEAIVRGWSIRYGSCCNYSGTHDLDKLTVKDFNNLVRMVFKEQH